jgi:hypothetical protein
MRGLTELYKTSSHALHDGGHDELGKDMTFAERLLIW